MVSYLEEFLRIKNLCYANEGQIASVIRIRRYINGHYDEEIDLDDLANKAAMSKFHLLRTYKRYYGQTPHQYLREKRIQVAKELLRNGRSVTEVCFLVGFVSLGSFSSLFTKKVGVTPSKYKKSNFREM